MIKSLRHLTSRDKRALAVFFAIALLCGLYFASGILVTYVSSPSDAMEMAKDGAGYTVRVLGLRTYAVAEQLSNAIREHRRVQTVIEAVPPDQGYVIKIGPLAKREAAELLTSELYSSGYSLVKIIENEPARTTPTSPDNGQRK
jgi:hypothetical protein